MSSSRLTLTYKPLSVVTDFEPSPKGNDVSSGGGGAGGIERDAAPSSIGPRSSKSDRKKFIKRLEEITHFKRVELENILTLFFKQAQGNSLRKAEYSKLMRKLGISDPFLQDLMFNAIDADGGGSIDAEEYIVALSHLTRGTQEEKLDFMFVLYDLNNDGSLAKDELLRIMKALTSPEGFESAKKYVDEIYDVIDADGSGEVSMEEFREAVQDKPELRAQLTSLKSFSIPPEGSAADGDNKYADIGDRTDNLQPCSLSWYQICCTTIVQGRHSWESEELELVSNVSGRVSSGEMLCVLGNAQNSGASALLAILAGRLEEGTTGDIYLNGEPKNSLFPRYVGYMQGNQPLVSCMTVFESLQFSSRLQNPKLTTNERRNSINDLLAKVGLQRVANSDIKHLTPTHRALMLIAQQMVSGQQVLFLDDPTYGLDAKSSLDVMRLLQKMSRQQRAIVCAMQQPSSYVFQMFDQVLLMDQGELVYFGPRVRISSFFQTTGFDVPSKCNPAEYLVILCGAPPQKRGQPRPIQRVREKLAPVCQLSEDDVINSSTPLGGDIATSLALSLSGGGALGSDGEVILPYASSNFREFRILFGRSLTRGLRDRGVLFGRLLSNVFLAVILGGLFFAQELVAEQVIDRLALTFFGTVLTSIVSLNQVIWFIDERSIFRFQGRACMYRVSSWILVQLCFTVLYDFVCALSFSLIVYPMANMHPGASHFFYFVLAFWMLQVCLDSMVGCFSMALETVAAAKSATSFVLVLSVLFAGFFKLKGKMPPYWVWLHHASMHKYAYQAVYVSDMRGLQFSCGDGCVMTAEEILEQQGLGDVDPAFSVAMLVAMSIAWRLLQACIVVYRGPAAGMDVRHTSLARPGWGYRWGQARLHRRKIEHYIPVHNPAWDEDM